MCQSVQSALFHVISCDPLFFLSVQAGQERFHCLGPLYYRDSQGAVVLYDVTDSESFSKAKAWIQELRNILGETVSILLEVLLI